MKAGYIYILHFLKPYKHAKHYIGYAERANRLYEHFTGKYRSCEPKLLKAAREAGVDFILSKSMPGDRRFERKIKNVGHAEYYCPVCKLDREIKALQKKIQEGYLFVEEILKMIEEKQSHLEMMIDEMKNHVEFVKRKGERKIKNVA